MKLIYSRYIWQSRWPAVRLTAELEVRKMRCRYTKWSLVIIVILSIILLVSYSPNESQSEYNKENVLEKRTHEGKPNSQKGGLVLETLQVLKDTQEFSEKVNKIGRKDWHLAEYLMNTRALRNSNL